MVRTAITVEGLWPVLFSVLLLGIAGCSAPEPESVGNDRKAARSANGPRTRPSAEQLIVVAIDGMEPALLDRFLAAGRMPVLDRLIDNGSRGSIDCLYGTVSPVVWTTVATGRAPKIHGITDFMIEGVSARSIHRRVPAFWNLLHGAGVEVATVGWWATWPARTDAGTVISDRAWHGRSESVYPPEALPIQLDVRSGLSPDYLRLFTSYPYDSDYESYSREDSRYVNNFLLERRLVKIYDRDRWFVDVARRLLSRVRPRVISVYIKGVDYTSHGFWKFHQPAPFLDAGWVISQEEIDLLGGVIPGYYQHADSLVGEILEHADPEATVIVLSDHGFGPRLNLDESTAGEKINAAFQLDNRKPTLSDFMSGSHRDRAVLIVSGPLARRAVKQEEVITHIDIAPTLLHLLAVPIPVDLPGRVLSEYFTDGLGAADRTAPPAGESFRDPVAKSGSTEGEVEILEELRSLGYIE